MSNHLRVLFATNNYTPYSGGVVSSIQASTNELQNQGHEVFIATLDFLGHGHHDDPDYVFRLPCPIKFLYKNNYMALPIRACHNMKKLVQHLRPHIIHSHHPFLLGKAALKIANDYSIPIVFTHHSLYERWSHVIPLPAGVSCPLIRSYVRKYCNQVSGIIAPSGMVKESLVERGVNKPIAVIPSGLQKLFSPLCRFVEKKISINQPLELISVTRFSPEKNIPFLLELIAELLKKDINCRLSLVGYGTLWHQMKEYAYKELGLSSKYVSFIYRPEKERLAKLYRNADIFIFSSQLDTQGIVLAEAMAGGTPVLALDGAGQRDIIEQGKNGFILNSMPAIIDCIEKLCNDVTMLKKLSYNSWQTAKRYKIDNVSIHLVEFYKQFIR